MWREKVRSEESMGGGYTTERRASFDFLDSWTGDTGQHCISGRYNGLMEARDELGRESGRGCASSASMGCMV